MKKKFDFAYTTSLPPHPIGLAIDFMLKLDDLYEERRPFAEGEPGLLDIYAQRLLDGDANSQKAFAALAGLMNESGTDGFKMTEEHEEDLFMAIVVVGLHAAVEALLAETVEEAYEHVIDARSMETLLVGVEYIGHQARVMAEFSRKGGRAGKPEHRESKARITEWYVKNESNLRNLSVDRVVKESLKEEDGNFRTRQDWIKEIRKSLTQKKLA